jgi:hypothetical protein
MVDLKNQHRSNLLKYQDREHIKESVSLHSRLHFMLVSGYAAHDCQMRSNFYTQSGNADTDFDSTEQKGDVVIEMSGK